MASKLAKANSRSRTREFGNSTTTLNTRSESNRMKDHNCELLQMRSPDLLADELTCWERFKQRLMQSILVAGESYRCQLYLKSSASVSTEKQRQMDSVHWYIIHPFSELRSIWQYVMCFVLIVSLFTTPFSLAFTGRKTYMHQFWYSIDFFFDVVCLVNVAMTFLTGAFEDATKEIILEPWIISRNYLRSFFLIDLISSLPYMFTMNYVKSMDESVIHAVTEIFFFLSLTRLYRIRPFLLFLYAIFEMQAFSPASYRISRLLLIYAIFVHWVACIHYLAPFLVHWKDLASVKSSWVVKAHLIDCSMMSKYQSSMFQSFSKFLMLGIGQNYPETSEDSVVTFLTIICASFLNAYVFSVFLHLRASFNSSETKYLDSVLQLEQYMSNTKLPMNTQNKLITYHEHIFNNSYYKEAAILATLSDALRVDIKMHICRRLVANVSIFQGLPTHIIYSVVSKMHSEVCLPNDIIIKAGTTGDCMFFLAKGTAAVMTPTGKEVCHLDDGAYFGEIALIDSEERRVANVIAVDICDIYRLDRNDFIVCISPHPELFARIERIAIERMERTLVMEEQHKKRLVERALKQWAKSAEKK